MGTDVGRGEKSGGDVEGGSGAWLGAGGRTTSVTVAQTGHERRRMRLCLILKERVWGTRSDAQRGQGGGSEQMPCGSVARAREA